MIMRPRLRKLALAMHLTVAVGWIGAVLAYLVLDVSVATSEDPRVLRAAWIAMGLVVSSAVVPLALATLLTGLAMSLGTKWGLFWHWWVVMSLLLTVAAVLVLLVEEPVVTANAARAADPTTSTRALLAIPPTLPHSVGGLIVLLVIQVLNVYKPRGLTAYGWHRLQGQRQRFERRRASAGGSG